MNASNLKWTSYAIGGRTESTSSRLAYALPSEEKTEKELRSLKQIKDSFLKVVIVGGMQPTFRNDDGILILNIFDFLLNRGGQNL